jgi:hypothetical protein
MHVGAANAGHLGTNQSGAGFEPGSHGVFAELQGLMELHQNGGLGKS